MTNLAFYLKYRPQTLDELIGQEGVKKTLFSAYQTNKLSHAYLFVGPRGTGKTSTARILAKMVNCESQANVILGTSGARTPESSMEDSGPSLTWGQARMTKNTIPCNKCSTCLSITDGSNLDLIEIDAASNRGIEDIRSLREKIKLAPTTSKKKVYIIDEVHMLTQEAFNALLKTLEEPPAHVLFILATTDIGKVPQTIISRVQRLDFKLASTNQLKQALEKIIKEERINIDEEAINIVIKKAEGSFRDVVKLVDQVTSLGKKITTEVLEESLSSSKFDDLWDFCQKIAEKKVGDGLINIQKQIEKGLDIKELMLSIMDMLRNLILIKNGVGQQLVELNFTAENYQKLVDLSGKFGSQDLVKDLDILQNSFEKLRFTSIPSLPLELAVVEICGSSEYSENSVGQRKSEGQKVSGSVDKNSETSKQKEETNQISDEPIFQSTDTQISSDLSVTPSSPDSSDILKLKEKWAYVLETIRPYNFSLEALLRSISIKECNETNIVMEVPYSFHQRILEAPKNKDLLESVLSDILGRQMKILTILGNRPQKREDVSNIEVAQDDEIIRVAAEIFNSDSIN